MGGGGGLESLYETLWGFVRGTFEFIVCTVSLRRIVRGMFKFIVCTKSLPAIVNSLLKIIVCTESLRGIVTGSLKFFVCTQSLRLIVTGLLESFVCAESLRQIVTCTIKFIVCYQFVYFSATVSLFSLSERYFRSYKWHLSILEKICIVSAKQAFPQPYTVCGLCKPSSEPLLWLTRIILGFFVD